MQPSLTLANIFLSYVSPAICLTFWWTGNVRHRQIFVSLSSKTQRCKVAQVQAFTSWFLLNFIWVFIFSIFTTLVYFFPLLFLYQLRFVICLSINFVKHSAIIHQTSFKIVLVFKTCTLLQVLLAGHLRILIQSLSGFWKWCDMCFCFGRTLNIKWKL